MKDLKDKVAVITGAASGIGRELAINLAKKGSILAIADIDTENLNETSIAVEKEGAEIFKKKLDVSQRKEMYHFANEIQERFGCVHLVINNAGVTLAESIEDTKYEDFEWIMDINFWGMVNGTKAFLPILKNVSDAHIVNISSLFGLVSFPCQGAYNASKFAIRGFTEALARELKGSTISVSLVIPGGIKTNITRNSRFYKEASGNTDKNHAVEKFEKIARTSASEAAIIIIKGILKNKKRIVIGLDTRIVSLLQRLFPVCYGNILEKLIG